MKKTYETIIIFEPKPGIAEAEIRKFREDITKLDGTIIKVEDMGIKKLAYEVKTYKEGYYAIYTWAGNTPQVTELERLLRIDDHVIKFITVKRDDDDEDYDKDLAETETKIPDGNESEQQPDAIDVLLGLAEYKKKEKKEVVDIVYN